MTKSSKLLATSLTILSVFLCGASCQTKPDAFICTFVVKQPIEKSFSFCVNAKTQAEKEVPVGDMNKWQTTDQQSYDTLRTWYQSQCKQ